MKKSFKINIKRVPVWFYIGIILAALYLPLILLFAFSFSDSEALGSFSEFGGFTFDNYADIFADGEILAAIGNTFLIAGVSAVLATLLGTLGAVGIFFSRKRWRNIMNNASQLPVLNADIITAIALMMFFLLLGAGEGYVPLILCHMVICAPYVVLSVMPRLSQLNPDMYEAALDLGATPMQALRKVLFPQLLPGMISGFMLAFTLSIDDFVITYFNKGSIDTISTLIYEKLQGKKGIPPAFRALSVLIFVVILGMLIVINIRARKLEKKVK